MLKPACNLCGADPAIDLVDFEIALGTDKMDMHIIVGNKYNKMGLLQQKPDVHICHGCLIVGLDSLKSELIKREAGEVVSKSEPLPPSATDEGPC